MALPPKPEPQLSTGSLRVLADLSGGPGWELTCEWGALAAALAVPGIAGRQLGRSGEGVDEGMVSTTALTWTLGTAC